MYSTHKLCLKRSMGTLLFLCCFVASLAPKSAHADLKQCAKELYSCGKNAALTAYYTVDAAAGILEYAVTNGPCLAAMGSGNPVTIGVTGVVTGLGVVGVIGKTKSSCEADIYSVAAKPLATGLDAILPNSNLTSLVQNGVDSAFKATVQAIPNPFPLPMTVGGLIDCGCGALDAGAQAVADVKRVGEFASKTLESCSAAVNACPGLKQALSAIKWIGTAAEDTWKAVSNPLESCSSMSRTEYAAARLRPLTPGIVDQFRKNIAWTGSPQEAELSNAMATCRKYYENHCYSDGDAASFCDGPVFKQNVDDGLWAAIGNMMIDEKFDLYFNKEARKSLEPIPNCPKVDASLSINPNAVGAEEVAKQARNSNAAACNEAVQNMIKGSDRSLYNLAKDLLPSSKDGWNELRLAGQAKKPVTLTEEVIFRRALYAAAAVTKSKLGEQVPQFVAQDISLQKDGNLAGAPFTVLNQRYSVWAFNQILFNIGKCPADKKGWANKFDKQCVQELATSVGYKAQLPTTIKLDGVVVSNLPGGVTPDSFKGAAYYNEAYAAMTDKPIVPPIRLPGASAKPAAQLVEERMEIYEDRWQKLARPKIQQQFNSAIAGFMTTHAERVAAIRQQRKDQEAIFTAFLTGMIITDGTRIKSYCARVQSATGCEPRIDAVRDEEVKDYAATLDSIFGGLTDNELVPAAKVTAQLGNLRTRHERTLRQYEQAFASWGASLANLQKQAMADAVIQHSRNNPPRIVVVNVSGPGTSGNSSSGGGAGSAPDRTRQSSEQREREERQARDNQRRRDAIEELERDRDRETREREERLLRERARDSGRRSDQVAAVTTKEPVKPVTVPDTPVIQTSRPLPDPTPDRTGGARTAGPIGMQVAPGMVAVAPRPAPPAVATQMVPPPPPPPSPGAVAAPPSVPAGTNVKDQVVRVAPPTGVAQMTPPPPPAPSPIAMVAPPPELTGTNLRDQTPRAAPPAVSTQASPPPPPAFNEAQYRSSRKQAMEVEWLAPCKSDTGCHRVVGGLLSQWLDAEVGRIRSDTTILNNASRLNQLQESIEDSYEARIKQQWPKPPTTTQILKDIPTTLGTPKPNVPQPSNRR